MNPCPLLIQEGWPPTASRLTADGGVGGDVRFHVDVSTFWAAALCLSPPGRFRLCGVPGPDPPHTCGNTVRQLSRRRARRIPERGHVLRARPLLVGPGGQTRLGLPGALLR